MPDLVLIDGGKGQLEAAIKALENQVKSYSPIPWHPGAVKYMTEHGVKM